MTYARIVIAQTSLQPEAIGVLVVLGVAVISLLVAAATLIRSRARRRRHHRRVVAHTPAPDHFEDATAEQVVEAADRALYTRDGATTAAAALRLHHLGHGEAMPYLLHALRIAPRHQREELLRAAAAHGPEQLAQHPLLAAALDEPVLERLRDAVQSSSDAARTSTASSRSR